jgi:hypothetical protein
MSDTRRPVSERIYALLLRLHASNFHQAYSADALQLFRDRFRDETGFFLRLRLWFDLLSDLAISVPRGYRCVPPSLVSASAQQNPERIPSFFLLEGEMPSHRALVMGGLLSLTLVATLFVATGHSRNYLSSDAFKHRLFVFAPQSGRGQSTPQVALGAPATTGAGLVDTAERQKVIDSAIADLKEHYIDPDVARKIAEALSREQKEGNYDAIKDGAAFARLVTRQLRDISHDAHLEVIYSQNALRDGPPGPTPEGLAQYRRAMAESNCTFEKVGILQHDIGYLKLNSFPDPSVCRQAATDAMAAVNRAGTIIFDLRDNRGGYPDMVMLIAGYLFDHPEYLYNPRENTTRDSWTRSPVPGNKLSDKPVYLLTSGTTASGAEQFSYDLKMLKRATLVGETTRGSAHSGVFYRIDDHFGIGIPEANPINPFSDKDWEGTGVEPDIKVQAPDALKIALERAGAHARH